MDSTTQDLKHRTKDQPPISDTTTTTQKPRQPTPLPKRGIRSLVIAITIPLSLTLATIYFSGWSRTYRTTQKPFWVPPLWALHLTYTSSAFIMGLSAWLVWADGGFHKDPSAMGVYLAQLGLSLGWVPVFFKMGAVKLGLLVCLGQIVTMFSCSRKFSRVNPMAGDLVKLCLMLYGYVTLVNLYFVV